MKSTFILDKEELNSQAIEKLLKNELQLSVSDDLILYLKNI